MRSKTPDLDRTDRKILDILQRDGRISIAEPLGRLLCVDPTTQVIRGRQDVPKRPRWALVPWHRMLASHARS
ncbi:AsnC family transcriptional regulator [Variovorax humicola]|uniref:AsnC family transcriptional regulator n=1 Tax=Variovorax humicola TaxID=1769758 RepID=A0ABU8W189_9BURK